MKKVKAFTTMELSIVMLMAGLISSLAYGGYSFFVRQLHTHASETQNALDVEGLLLRLKKDIGECKVMLVNGPVLECRSKKQAVQYDFENENYLLRTQAARTDTFHIRVTGHRFLFEGNVPGRDRVTDALELDIDYKKTTTGLVFKKQYSNQDLVEKREEYGH